MVTPSFFPIKGGTETVVKNLSVGLNRIGIHTDVMTYNMEQKWRPVSRGETQNVFGLKVFKIPGLNWFPIEHSDRITSRINLIPGRFRGLFKNYDVIHFHDGGDLSFPFFSFLTRKPKILHLHGLNLDYYQRYFLGKFILKNVANLYIPIFQDISKELVRLGIKERKIKCLPNGIDIDVFRPILKKRSNMVLFVGRIDPLKGLHVLLKSIRMINRRVHLVIIGPHGWNRSYVSSVLTMVKRMKEYSNLTVTYLGELQIEKIVRWYQEASVLVRPDTQGASGGLTSLEALACGTPVIATGNDIVKDGVNGILVPYNDSTKLADAIEYLLENEDVRIRLGKEGRLLIEKNYSNKVIVERLSHIYEKLAKQE